MKQVSPPVSKLLGYWYIGVAVLMVAAASILRLESRMQPTALPPASPVMPTPNAFEYFNSAAQEERDGAIITHAVSPALPLPQGYDSVLAKEPTSGFHIFTLRQKESLLRENAAAIAEARRGMHDPYMAPPVQSFDADMSDVTGLRDVAQLFALAGQVDAARGDDAAAMWADVDAIHLGSDLGHGGDALGALAGIACEAIGRRPAEKIVDRLSASEAETEALRLQWICEHNEVGPVETLRQELADNQGILLDLFQQRDWRAEVSQLADPADADTAHLWSFTSRFELRIESPRTAFDDYTGYMEQVIGRAALPWPQYRALPQVPEPTDPVDQFLLPNFEGVVFKETANLALDRLFETQLALRAYRIEHRRYPASLSELVPKYLNAVPQDPFADNAPLQYRLTNKRDLVRRSGSSEEIATVVAAGAAKPYYLLYSIGPDAKDDGGAPIDHKAQTADQLSVLWDANESGDIVAGVNE